MRLIHRCWLVALVTAAALSPALCAAQSGQASSAPAADMVLLLPLRSPEFARAAEALRLGFMAARERAGHALPIAVRATDASNEQILAEYQAAVAAGARVIVGPMTRAGVAALAVSKLVTVPTLALNYPEGRMQLPDKLYAFGLSVELEARMVARQAWFDGVRKALIVTAAAALQRRADQAFADEWLALGGSIVATQEFSPYTDLTELKQRLTQYDSEADFVFLAADVEQARTVRPFFNNLIPTYATSLVYSARTDPLANVDLNGIRFVEMPWLVQPDHPAVMIYPRPNAFATDQERFYALGIDAFRVASDLAVNRNHISLDGVTGHLTLSGNLIEREPVPATFRDGAAVALEPTR